ncbi:superoxide dismutase family protein [Nesterenkonia sp. PF2B19]|uniref:superoxide dismutase family protein n=1 Tax=Nesterenkonia sp. PF2B19 TaxID=1881858 RepID=UPI00191C79E7|nr:superoxide dismutase family protein [Nesterenkonia sp. PF2B19]
MSDRMIPDVTYPLDGGLRAASPRVLVGLALSLGLALTACGGEESPGADQDAAGQDAADQDPADASTDDGEQSGEHETSAEPFASADLADAVGNEVGEVTFSEVDAGVLVEVQVQDLESGFRGFHIHEHGACEPQSTNDDGDIGDFLSAGGHLPGEGEEDHGLVEGEEAPETDDAEGAEEAEAPDGDPQDAEDVQAGADHPGHAGDLPNLLVAQDGTARMSVVTDRLDPELLLEGDGTAVIIHAGADNHANIPERYAPQGPDEETRGAGDAGERSACGVVEGS